MRKGTLTHIFQFFSIFDNSQNQWKELLIHTSVQLKQIIASSFHSDMHVNSNAIFLKLLYNQ